jgi:hypothetical protein
MQLILVTLPVFQILPERSNWRELDKVEGLVKKLKKHFKK